MEREQSSSTGASLALSISTTGQLAVMICLSKSHESLGGAVCEVAISGQPVKSVSSEQRVNPKKRGVCLGMQQPCPLGHVGANTPVNQ